MAYVYTSNLIPDMVTESDVFNYNDQLIVPKATVLTDTLISRLEYYSIPRVNIVPKTVTYSSSIIPSYSEKVLHSREFKEFSRNFASNIEALEIAIHDVLDNEKPLDEVALLAQTDKLIPNNTTTIGLLDMIHNTRSYDDSTYAHSVNVSLICNIMATWLNFSDEDKAVLTLCGLTHDIGKINIPNDIIKKPSKLTEEEFDIMKSHAQRSYDCLKNQDIDKRIKNAALMHHERCDGSGYPNRLTINQIDDFAKIVAIADVYDAMTAARVYRGALCPFKVISIFEEEGLKKYDPHFILTFLERIVSSYMNNIVRLSDNRIGEVVMINPSWLSRPVVRIDHEYVDLSTTPDLYIVEIV